MEKCKIRCENEDKTAQVICEEELSILCKRLNAKISEIAEHLPTIEQVKACLQKYKKKYHSNNLPKSIQEIVIDGEKFLILNKSQNKILLFCSPTGLEALAYATQWHGDGTFFTAA
jgi:hypothetical protein